jgi:hypothetical protein
MTDNELIAEFMGAERREGPRAFNPDQTIVQWIIKGNPYNQHRDDVKHWYQPVELKYHESWDWLMPVVHKIKEVCPSAFEFDNDTGPNSAFAILQVCDPIEDIYKQVVEFIKWYNEQKLNPLTN